MAGGLDTAVCACPSKSTDCAGGSSAGASADARAGVSGRLRTMAGVCPSESGTSSGSGGAGGSVCGPSSCSSGRFGTAAGAGDCGTLTAFGGGSIDLLSVATIRSGPDSTGTLSDSDNVNCDMFAAFDDDCVATVGRIADGVAEAVVRVPVC